MTFIHKMDIEKEVQEKNKETKVIETKWIKTYTNVPCHLSMKSLGKNVVDPSTGADQYWTLFFPLGIKASNGDKVIIDTGYDTYVFKCQKPFSYPRVKRQQMALDKWEE